MFISFTCAWPTICRLANWSCDLYWIGPFIADFKILLLDICSIAIVGQLNYIEVLKVNIYEHYRCIFFSGSQGAGDIRVWSLQSHHILYCANEIFKGLGFIWIKIIGFIWIKINELKFSRINVYNIPLLYISLTLFLYIQNWKMQNWKMNNWKINTFKACK